MRYFGHLYQLIAQPRSIFGDPDHDLNTHTGRLKFCMISCIASGALLSGSELISEISRPSPSLLSVLGVFIFSSVAYLVVALVLMPISAFLTHSVGEKDHLRLAFLVVGIGSLGPFVVLPLQHLQNVGWVILCPSLYAALVVWPNSFAQSKSSPLPHISAFILLSALYGAYQFSEGARKSIGDDIVEHLGQGISPGPHAPQTRIVRKPTRRQEDAGFEKLDDHQKKWIQSTYDRAFQYYGAREYEKALTEVQQIFALVMDYKEARKIELYAKDAIARKGAQSPRSPATSQH